jgi:hypothetical protein
LPDSLHALPIVQVSRVLSFCPKLAALPADGLFDEVQRLLEQADPVDAKSYHFVSTGAEAGASPLDER